MSRRFLIVILILAGFLRLVSLSSFPYFNQDEAGLGYDAYSILKTGRDHWGSSFPLVLRSFGDFKMPLYSYLAIPSVALFGLNEFAVRFPGAIFGSLAIIVTYYLALELGRPHFAKASRGELGKLGKKVKPEYFALLTAMLLAASPWHIMLSRGAFEANLTSFFLPLGVLGFLKGLKKPSWLYLSSLAFGLNMFSYHSARIVTPLIFVFLLLLFRKDFSKIASKFKWRFLIIFGLFLMATSLTFFQGAGTRAQDLSVFKGALEEAAPRRLAIEESGVPPIIARLFQNKFRIASERFVSNYFQYYSPRFLLTDGASGATYGMIPGIGVIHWFSGIFLVGFTIFLWKNRRTLYKGVWLIVFWIIIAPIPAAFAAGVGYAGNRAAVVMPVLQIAIGTGAVYLYSILRNYYPTKFTKHIIVTSTFILVFTVVIFTDLYFGKYSSEIGSSTSYGIKDAVVYVSEIEDNLNA